MSHLHYYWLQDKYTGDSGRWRERELPPFGSILDCSILSEESITATLWHLEEDPKSLLDAWKSKLSLCKTFSTRIQTVISCPSNYYCHSFRMLYELWYKAVTHMVFFLLKTNNQLQYSISNGCHDLIELKSIEARYCWQYWHICIFKG